MSQKGRAEELKVLAQAKKICGIQAIEIEPEQPAENDCDFCDDEFLCMAVSADSYESGSDSIVFFGMDDDEPEEPDARLRLQRRRPHVPGLREPRPLDAHPHPGPPRAGHRIHSCTQSPGEPKAKNLG